MAVSLEQRAKEALEKLKLRQDVAYSWADLCSLIGEHGGDKSRRVVRLMRDRAADEGLCLRPAVPKNGFTYMLTAQGAELIASHKHMGAILAGVARRQDEVGTTIAANPAGVDAHDLAYVATAKGVAAAAQGMEAMRQAHLAEQKAAASLIKFAAADAAKK